MNDAASPVFELVPVATAPPDGASVPAPLDLAGIRRLQVCAEGFVSSLSRSGQVTTSRTYEKRLRCFFGWLTAKAQAPHWNIPLFQGYRAYLQEHPALRSTLTKNGYLTAARQFSQYLHRLGLMPHDPGAFVKGWKASGRHRRVPLPYADAQAWLEQLEQDPRKTPLERLRNVALGYLLIKTGLRTCEAASAELRGLVHDPKGGWLLMIRGKGQAADERDWVRCVPAVMEKLSRYLECRGVQPGDQGPLFASIPLRHRRGHLIRPGGQPITTWTIHHVLTEGLLLAGVKKTGIVVHSLRHSTATYALMHDAPPQRVQAMMRHKSYRTTQLYVSTTQRLLDGAEDYVTQI